MKLLKLLSRLFAKPTKCPNCGNEYFYWDEEDSNGRVTWRCGKCNYPIKD